MIPLDPSSKNTYIVFMADKKLKVGWFLLISLIN